MTENLKPVEIVPVRGRKMLKRFIAFPIRLYKDCDKWVPAFRDDEFKSLGDNNPSLAFCERELYLAMRSGKVVGRVAALDGAGRSLLSFHRKNKDGTKAK